MKIQAEANRANSERLMQGFLGNRRIEPLEKEITPQGDGCSRRGLLCATDTGALD
jgi:hypothetical protein